MNWNWDGLNYRKERGCVISIPIFYSGGGAGYSGRPEVEDTMHLYFPSKNEEDL